MQYLQSSIAKGATETPPQRKINEWTTSSTQEINIPDIQRIDTFFQQRVGSHHKIGVEPVLAFVKYESAVHNTETLSGGDYYGGGWGVDCGDSTACCPDA